MIAFYHIFIWCYAFGIRIASLFNKKAKLWVEGRRHVLDRIKSTLNPEDEIVWFHCASLGEFEQAKPVIEKLKINFPTFKILVTFFSPSGFEHRKNDPLIDYVFYLPIDTLKNAKTFIKTVQPQLAFFVKYEFWFNYMMKLKQNNIPTYLVSGVFRENQLFFKWYGAWYKKVLNGFTHFFVQNETSKNILLQHHFTNVTLSGDTRFDRVFENALTPKKLPLIEQFKTDNILLVGGSTWQPEEQILANYSMLNPHFKLIIAPHDISENHLKQIEQLFNKKCLRYSQANENNVSSQPVLIIDNIGLLANIYQYSDVAFVGGGFSGALHNILEPAGFGNVVLFGPKHHKFHEAQELIIAKGAFEITDTTDFKAKTTLILDNLTVYKNNSKKFVTANIGATDTVIRFLLNFKK